LFLFVITENDVLCKLGLEIKALSCIKNCIRLVSKCMLYYNIV